MLDIFKHIKNDIFYSIEKINKISDLCYNST